MLYIVVPTFNRLEIFNKFIKQLNDQKNQDYYLVAVDHGKMKTGYSAQNCKTIESDVNGWSYAINIGIRYILSVANESDHILIINDDVVMDNSYISSVLQIINDFPNGVIGSVCFDCASGKTLHVNMKLNRIKATYDYLHKGENYISLKGNMYDSDVLKGRGTIYPMTVFKELGVFNEKCLPHYRADHEMAWRAKINGYYVAVSGDLALGAVLDSPHIIEKKYSFVENYRRIFIDMISTHNTKDLRNYSYCCFKPIYATYFFLINWLRDHLFFVYKSVRMKG